MFAISPDSVGFVPFVEDPVPVYRALDVVLHASTQPEPFGLTVVEAMACGRAVVVSAAGGAAELFTDGVDALGVAARERRSARIGGRTARFRSRISAHNSARGPRHRHRALRREPLRGAVVSGLPIGRWFLIVSHDC